MLEDTVTVISQFLLLSIHIYNTMYLVIVDLIQQAKFYKRDPIYGLT